MTIFATLADTTRLHIVELLAESGELPAGRIAERFDMTRAGVSRHLRNLEEAGVVLVRVDAQRRMYRLNPEPFREMEDWLRRHRTFWTRRFARLKQHVEKER